MHAGLAGVSERAAGLKAAAVLEGRASDRAMMHFKTLSVCPAEQEPLVPVQVDYRRVHELLLPFRKLLLQNSGDFGTAISIPGHKPIYMFWLPSGQTAGDAFWTRATRIEAASLLLSGLDEEEDVQAIHRAAALPAPPFSNRQFAELAELERPLLVNVYPARAIPEETPVPAASLALAAAFFSLLGVGETETSASS